MGSCIAVGLTPGGFRPVATHRYLAREGLFRGFGTTEDSDVVQALNPTSSRNPDFEHRAGGLGLAGLSRLILIRVLVTGLAKDNTGVHSVK